MTYLEALEALHTDKQFVAREAWLEQDNGVHQFLIPQGDYSKTKEELYSKLKTLAEFFKKSGAKIEPHADLVLVSDKEGLLVVQPGYQFTSEDLWASDYFVLSMDDKEEANIDAENVPAEDAEIKGNPDAAPEVNQKASVEETTSTAAPETPTESTPKTVPVPAKPKKSKASDEAGTV